MAFLYRYTFLLMYIIISLMIFEKVFKTTQTVIDEEFHLRQGLHFCKGNFNIWDPKITTFPGLYLVSTLLLYYPQLCNVFMLRFTSLIASVINVYLIHEIRSHNLGLNKKKYNIESAIETLTISILPPMYFFVHIYYTDVLSITAVLGMVLLSLKQKHNFAAIFGIASILMRQTNIVWVAMIFGSNVIDQIITKVLPRTKATNISKMQFFSLIKLHFQNPKLIYIQFKDIIISFYAYILLILGFIAFLVINGSIVVGDKQAHEATLHIPQIFYFSLFVLFFGPSIWLPYITHFLGTLRSLRYLKYYALLAVISVIVIKFNTLVHPYLLADNRHYMFYIWNRFYGRYEYARYLAIPAYITSLAIIWKTIEQNTIGFKTLFVTSLIVALCLQRLIELRYFLIPFLILRLNVKHRNMRNVIVEMLSNLCVNVITFYLFFTKEIQWSNYTEPQRLIW